MKWSRKNIDWGRFNFTARKGGIKFTLEKNRNTGKYYILANKENQIFNSLWYSIDFETDEQAKQFCETFKVEDYK